MEFRSPAPQKGLGKAESTAFDDHTTPATSVKGCRKLSKLTLECKIPKTKPSTQIDKGDQNVPYWIHKFKNHTLSSNLTVFMQSRVKPGILYV